MVEPARAEGLVELGPAAYGLSSREQQVVALVARSASTARIAATLHISQYAVQTTCRACSTRSGSATAAPWSGGRSSMCSTRRCSKAAPDAVEGCAHHHHRAGVPAPRRGCQTRDQK